MVLTTTKKKLPIMDLKKFKAVRSSLTETTLSLVSDEYLIEVVKSNNHFTLFVNDLPMESFRTEDAAVVAAYDAVDSLGNENE
jgi:hypothetical protein